MGALLLNNNAKAMILWVLIVVLGQVNGVVAEEVPGIVRGKEVYLSYGCAVCHGKEGLGDGVIAMTFDPRPTNFHDPKDYRQGTDNYHIRLAIKNGVQAQNNAMPAFEDIDANDLQDLIDFIKSLQIKDKK